MQGLDHVIFMTALEGKLLLRQYRIALKKSGTRVPRVELHEMGPSLDLSLRRVREAPSDLMAEALKQPKTTAKKARPTSRCWPVNPNVSSRVVEIRQQPCVYAIEARFDAALSVSDPINSKPKAVLSCRAASSMLTSTKSHHRKTLSQLRPRRPVSVKSLHTLSCRRRTCRRAC